MKIFPRNPNRPSRPNLESVDPPVGVECIYCTEKIVATDAGVIVPYSGDPHANEAYHQHCLMRHLDLMDSTDCEDCDGTGRDGGSSAPCPACLRRGADKRTAARLFTPKV